MKNFAMPGVLVLLFVSLAYADTTLDNEVTFGSAKYFSYSLIAGFSPDKVMHYGLDGSFSRGADHDGAFDLGGSLRYKINDAFNFRAAYKFNSDTSYPAYEKPVYITATATTYLWSFEQLLGVNTITPAVDMKLGPLELSPSIGEAINNLKGTLNIKKKAGLPGADRQLTDSTFNELSPGLDASYDAADFLSLSAGWTGNYYNVNVQQVLDASGATNTASKENAALKTAVQFQVYSVNTGFMLFLGDFMANFTYAYAYNYHASSGIQNNFTNDYNLLISYMFNKWFNMGVRLEDSVAHNTDGSYTPSKYLGVQLNFTIK